MIPKNEILTKAREQGLLASVVEKDYLLGWLLAGISANEILGKNLAFKGGTCLKKCYFDSYRFSEDLDFTALSHDIIDSEKLIKIFKGIADWIYEQSGIEIELTNIKMEIYKNPRNKESCQGSLYCRGPVTPKGNYSLPRVKLDITADEIIVDALIQNPVKHNFSDIPVSGISILSYSYLETFAEKIRALVERTRPRDLFDVIHLYQKSKLEYNIKNDLRSFLKKKCEFKNIDFPTFKDIEKQQYDCQQGWNTQLSHQLPSVPDFGHFWRNLKDFFIWLEK